MKCRIHYVSQSLILMRRGSSLCQVLSWGLEMWSNIQVHAKSTMQFCLLKQASVCVCVKRNHWSFAEFYSVQFPCVYQGSECQGLKHSYQKAGGSKLYLQKHVLPTLHHTWHFYLFQINSWWYPTLWIQQINVPIMLPLKTFMKCVHFCVGRWYIVK